LLGMEGLDRLQQTALVALFRAVADGEVSSERARCQLCETPNFQPYDTFMNLQSAHRSQRGWLTAADVHSWLAEQPHTLVGLSLDDVVAVVFPGCNIHDELRYEGFLRMVLPRDPSVAWLRDVVLRRGQQRNEPQSQIPPEVSYRLAQFLECEVDMSRHLRYQRKNLKDQGVDAVMVQRFFTEPGSTRSMLHAPLSGHSMYRNLVERAGELTPSQCDALLRRINPDNPALVSMEELTKMLSGPITMKSSLSPRSIAANQYRDLSPVHVRVLMDYERNKLNVSQSLRDSSYSLDVDRDWRFPLAARSCQSPNVGARPLPAHIYSPDSLPATPSRRSQLSAYGRASSIPSPVSSPKSVLIASNRDLFASPRTGSTAATRLELARAMDGQERLQPDIHVVLQLMKHQAELDVKVEDAKMGLPATMSLEGFFRTLDHFDKGYVTDTSLWRFTQDFGASTPFGSLCSLVHELQLRSRNKSACAGHLTMCSLGLLLFPMHSKEFEIVMRAGSDQEALSEIHVHKFSEPCPGCSIRVQRDGDSTGCPSVTCPVCNTSFQCHTVMGDGDIRQWEEHRVPHSVQYQLHRLIDIAAVAADELECGRKKLSFLPKQNLMSTLSAAFAHIANDRSSFVMADLRRAFLNAEMVLSEPELAALWRRYQPLHSEVNFSAFVAQLKPRTS